MSTGLVTGAAGGIGGAYVRPLAKSVHGEPSAAVVALGSVNIVAPGVIETPFLGEATTA